MSGNYFVGRCESWARNHENSKPQRIAVTGGSGFIGTNLIEYYLAAGVQEILNIDIKAPLRKEHRDSWVSADIRNFDQLSGVLTEFAPTAVFHLGARTDLAGRSVIEYGANVQGVSNMVAAVRRLTSSPRVIFASSRLVCRIGYQPRGEGDYCPTTPYGESKVLTETLIRDQAGDDFEWVIVRPTSIWGPWFDIPYRQFFEAVKGGRYRHPRGLRVQKSYGFVGNTAHQLDRLMFGGASSLLGRTIYLADSPPLELHDWAELIAQQFGVALKEAPVWVLRSAGKVGDLAESLGLTRVPLTSFRLNNLRTEMIYNLSEIEALVGDLPFTLAEGITLTLNWLSHADSK